ncbi:pyrrolysine--tRNA(Pyl) ligase small subunit [Phosphitispora fastidiosa]|uniref:pyrrolysine--tRNA(Pyl) ligase small subunit n=1 Tax=Phosphitispora fastidiosa TaxID=2837202 RepID=UPI001E51444F|nr:pyrrolysine--tRNA(Pyl) ligase small subunit [Phosphitispora fastidiosa]MBU7008392.1 pyrrolysyl-tRNA synthetase-like protein [Phosphitispora fastidiosa]
MSIRKHQPPGEIIQKIKLWPSLNGILHGVKSVKIKGAYIELITHCGQQIKIRNSRHSRVARWLRNKWYAGACPKCRVPEWKLEKYSQTKFL